MHLALRYYLSLTRWCGALWSHRHFIPAAVYSHFCRICACVAPTSNVDRSIDLCIETNRDGIRDTLCTDLCISQGFRSLTSLASGNFSRIFHFTTGCHNCPVRINTMLTQRLWTNEEQQDRDRTEWMKNREWTHTVELSPYNIGWGQGTGDSCGSHWCLQVLVMISKGWQWRGPD